MTEPPAAASARSRLARIAAWTAAILLVAGPPAHAAFGVGAPLEGPVPLLCVAVAVALFAASSALHVPLGRKRLFVGVASFVIVIVAVELLLRATLGPYHAAFLRAHPVWLYEYRPDTRRITSKQDRGTTTRVVCDVNADGFRGPPLRPAATAKRVMVYGDSFVAAMSTPWEETFVVRLGEELEPAAGGPVEAICAGVLGYGPDQALLRMQEEVPQLRPDLLVVVLLAENDCGDLVRNRLFDLDASGDLVRNDGRMTPEFREAFEHAESRPVAEKLYRSGLWSLRFAVQGGEVSMPTDAPSVLAACREEHVRAMRGLDEVPNLLWDHVDEDLRLEPQSASAQHKVLLLRRVLAAIRDLAAREKVPLLFVIAPSATDVVPGHPAGTVPAARHPAYRADNLTAPFVAAAHDLGVPAVDLFSTFRDADAEALYFEWPDVHWNSAGQALAARIAARAIESRGLLR